MLIDPGPMEPRRRPDRCPFAMGGRTSVLAAAVVLMCSGLISPLGGGHEAAAAATPASMTDVSRPPSDPVAHDPTMIKEGEYYHVFITGDSQRPNAYIPVKRSTDLTTWEELAPVFSSPPQWVVDTLGVTPRDFWAPDINYVDGTYYLYYAASRFGVNNSVIGLATNETLDPDSPDYRWVDAGLVLRSRATDDFNAIDPDLSFDEDGQAWLAFGSFWSGISLRRMDTTTGMPSERDPTRYPLVDRREPPNAVEGPSIVHHEGFYYLFASFDFCCRGVNSTYRVVVGRAPAITGPYVDESGESMLEGGGTEVLSGYDRYAGPGHGDVFVDGATVWYPHHYYDRSDAGAPKLSVRELTWDDGWPSLSEPLAGRG